MNMGDRISGLPDELLHHVMSFLSARDAVRTCVLSPRWRHLWVTARCLNVEAMGFSSQRKFIRFVTAMLLSRGCTPLDSFWLCANGPDMFLEYFHGTASQWICHALRSNVQELGIIDHDMIDAVDEEDGPAAFQLQHCPLTSSYLKRLHLCYIHVDDRFVKKLFSGCPGLEDLEMINCVILATEFSSATLKNLSIDNIRSPFFEEFD